jgi:hypothetical protein
LIILCYVKQLVKHLLLLEVKHPRWLDVSRVPKIVVSLGKVREGLLYLHKKRSKASESRKVVERDPTKSKICELHKLPQQRCRDHSGVV